MSFFYLCPVRGDMPIHLLETIVFKRIKFLSAITKGETAVFDEYVIEGSVYDNVGHFMLCTIAILSDNRTLTQFCLQSEYELFKRRLTALSAYDIRTFAKKLLRSIKKYDSVPRFIEPLQILCRHLLLKNVAQHISLGTHEHSCSAYNISLDFKHCLPYISTRQVELSNGIATVPCGKFKQYLTHLFRNNLEHQLAGTNMELLRNDPRIMELVQKVTKEHFPIAINNDKNILLSKDVDKISSTFPPCMLNLQRNLRTKHRLSHNQRFIFSLFLKDIGMPVDEAIEFWRMEYRQASAGSRCGHHWEKDEKKYLYGIRHMYGLEGARKNYTSVCCQRIQSNSNAGSEGGCPFKSFDSLKMLKLLDKKCTQSESIMSRINELQRQRQYSQACMLHHEETFYEDSTNNCDKLSFNFTPVNYYMIASKANKV